MFATMSLVTSMKDYIEVVHKLIETDPSFKITSYYDFGSILTFIIVSGKELIQHFLSFQWFQTISSIPTLIPDIASAMISEISIFDGSFQNTQTLLESPISYGNNNFLIYCSEKFMIGLLNSVFLCLPTSVAHIITLRRFVMQGLEAGFLSGLGTIAGNIVWIGSIVFGLRFVVIPWLSLDLFRAFLGFVLIVKYMWDSYTERRMILEDLSKYKIFFLTFLLSFTEQTTLYPFLTNLSLGSDSTLIESFPTENFYEFGFVHLSYLLGILIGSLSLLQFTCWFWENPAFQIYMWFISSFKTTTSVYSKIVNLTFLYLTMICAISNIAYFGLDYTLTNPLGFVHEDRLLDQKALLETAFLNTKASDRNTRRNRGRHGRRERWKRRVRRYRTFDASLYDQGVYDLFTLEDLNYGFDRFWLRRKIRNHRVRFRFFPGPWMRSFKKQLSRPRLESFMGPRVEFFRILFEQAYHPEFHEYSRTVSKKNLLKTNQKTSQKEASTGFSLPFFGDQKKEEQINQDGTIAFVRNGGTQENLQSIYWNPIGNKQERLLKEQSTLRKFVRKVNTRIKMAKIQNEIKSEQNLDTAFENSKNLTQPISSKTWKSFSPIEKGDLNSLSNTFEQNKDFSKKSEQNLVFQRFYKKILLQQEKNNNVFGVTVPELSPILTQKTLQNDSHLSKKDRFLERYKTFLRTPATINALQKNQKNSTFLPLTAENSSKQNEVSSSTLNLNKTTATSLRNVRNLQNESQYRSMTLLHPLNFYFQKEQSFKRKLKFYGVKLFRNFSVENNAPYFRVMMKRFFYHYKPTLRWERTLRVATMRRARRKSSRIPRKLNVSKTEQLLAINANNSVTLTQVDTNREDRLGFSSEKTTSDLKQQELGVEQSVITKPTHFYSLVEKRASRYRYQIYKDVLQHWYYSPLNRFLLKVDVDSFIRRQPKSYFLTKSDEKLLHLKRQLLSEYYETLRWYTYMQHYSTMKNQIGGTKSLSSRAYNQQFVGTFKKIRHLFNITPSLNDTNVLTFDQPLYNEYKKSQNLSIFNESIVHEELLADDLFFIENGKKGSNNSLIPFSKEASLLNKGMVENSTNGSLSRLPEDLPNQSATILREYLATVTPIRQDYIQRLLQEKNYWELTKFLFRGQKVRGTNPITNQTDFLNQEKNYLLSENLQTSTLDTKKFKEEMWIALLKKCQNKLYDQEALKNYVALKKEKYENKKQKHEKYLKNRLERMKESFILLSNNRDQNFKKNSTFNEKKRPHAMQQSGFQFDNFSGYTSSVQKAMKESIIWEKNSLSSSSFQTVEKFFAKKNFVQKTNIRNNRPNIYLSLNKNENLITSPANINSNISTQVNPQKMQSLVFRTNLKNSFKKRAVQIIEAENLFKNKLSSTKAKNKSLFANSLTPITSVKNFVWNMLRFKNLSFSKKKHEETTISFLREVQTKLLEKIPFGAMQNMSAKFWSVSKYGTLETSNKNLDFWKKRENALSKRRKIRKTLKRLRNQNSSTERILFENRDFSTQYSVPKSDNTLRPSRQKIDKNTENNQDLTFFSLRNEFSKKQQTTRSESWKKYYSFNSDVNRKQEQKTNSLQYGEERNNKVAQHSAPKSLLQKMVSFPKNLFEKRQKSLFTKKFVRKRSRLRRYSSFKGRGPIKKRTLREKFKRQFKSLKKYGATRENATSEQIQIERENKKFELIQSITQRSSSVGSLKGEENFLKREQKQRRTRQMKHRAWKKKKQNFAQKRRKLRKRRRSTISKIRVLNKKLKRILSKKEIQKWWWQTFFPSFQKTTENSWQSEKNMQIRKELFDLSEQEILERDQMNHTNNTYMYNSLQIGDKDYKPLAIPEALRIREKLVKKQVLHFNSPPFGGEEKSFVESNPVLYEKHTVEEHIENQKQNSKILNQHVLQTSEDSKLTLTAETIQSPSGSSDFLEKFTANFSTNQTNPLNSEQNGKLLIGTNPIPFYAGWDESLRKFVVTNRLLSRKDCFSFSPKAMNTIFNSKQNTNNSETTLQEFSKAPLQGMNAATTLYWQIPFTTYDPDQFFALGMDGFSPLGWRNFSFKHSKQTTKPILVKNFFSFKNNQKTFSKNLQFKFLENTLKTKIFDPNNCMHAGSYTERNNYSAQNCLNRNEFEKTNKIGFTNNIQNKLYSKTEIDKNFEYRRILKKQKRIKKHPRPPVWFPSGALSQQVLPVHYIYVFYKRSRLPRDRYIRRRLRSTFLQNQNVAETLSKNPTITKITDFTLRKRTKPRRKYHRKRFVVDTNQFLLRRRKFRSFLDENETTRPSSKLFETSSKQEKRNIKSKQRRKITDSKQSTENLRLRQLRRRVQRQVFRPVWRYRPRSGGFVWPGDYLRLELIKAPQLNSTPILKQENSDIPQQEISSRKIRKKKRRTLQEWQIQPKKYLLEKHNIKVLKKRFEKAIQNF